MTVLFFAMLCLGLVLLVFAAAPVKNTDPTWSWYAGVGCVAVAAFIAAINGWAA